MGPQLTQPDTFLLILVKGGCQMGSQVNPTTHRFWFWLKEIVRWDLKLTQPHTEFTFG